MAISIKEPHTLTRRITSLRDYFFRGTNRPWDNRHLSFTTGTSWDVQYNELTYHIVPETYPFFQTFRTSFRQNALIVNLRDDFWDLSIPERRAWFNKTVMTTVLPREIIPGDLIAGARFNIHTSFCLNEKEQKKRDAAIYGAKGLRQSVFNFHNHGYGNCGPTSGHLIPDYPRILKGGFKSVLQDLKHRYTSLSPEDRNGSPGDQLRAMMIAAEMPRELARSYQDEILALAGKEDNFRHRDELTRMAGNLSRVPWEGAETFWEAVQSLWLTHMLVMADENYPGPGVSFGRIDQYLFPYWEYSKSQGMTKEEAKEILGCFWFHANTAYDSMIAVGDQGITAGFGQLFTLSGLGAGGRDMTNELSYIFLEVIDEMSPILEPKPNVRLHRKSPEKLLDTVVDMIASSQGAPFLLNFDERSMAGMIRQARTAGLENLINEENVHDYAPVGCLENTMAGNDRSGTVDNNLNLLKAVELVLSDGKDMHAFVDNITGKTEKIRQDGPQTGNPRKFGAFDAFWKAYETQTQFIVRRCVELYDRGESLRAGYHPTPYLSCLVGGCAENALDITRGGAEINLTTIEAVTFATTVDSLLAVKYLVYDQEICTMDELFTALKENWVGHETLQARALYKAPKYGRDDNTADNMARRVMELWTGETWKYKTRATNRQFRPGMLSWNYWVGDGFLLAASPDGRTKGKFLSNAICPSDGADINGPTSNANSVGKVLGGKSLENGDWEDYVNLLPNGASHTMTFNPSLVRDAEQKDKFKAFLKGYAENGGTALQINMLDSETLKDAQKNPADYRHLLVRVTGYNAYFTSIGKELQDELIARVSHDRT